MRWAVHALTAIAMTTAGLTAGCRSAADNAYPQDPLFFAKKPIEKTTAPSVPILFAAVADPTPPAFPTTALAVPPGDRTGPERVPGTLAAGPKSGTVDATPAARVREAGVPADASSVYGRAPDGRWLQGVLEKHYLGYFDLRYEAPSSTDLSGGKVRLENDARLSAYHDGDVVRIEGMPVPDLNFTSHSQRDEYPRYRIQEIRLLVPPHLQANAAVP
jgi:hypothetical protein